MAANLFRTNDRQGRRGWKTWVLGAAVLGMSLACGPVGAATTTSTTFTVNATVQASCSISATNLNFATYDPTSATADSATSTVTVQCTNGTSYAISLDAGSTSGSTLTNRNMIDSSSDLLNYQLYTDSTLTTVWGDGSGSTQTVSGTGTGSSSQNYTVYGEVPVNQYVPSGTYSDTVTATVSY